MIPRKVIALEPYDASQIRQWLKLATQFLDDSLGVITPPKYQTALAHQSVGLLFFEPSTRTRVSFELAAKHLGASTILLNEQGSSMSKGESVMDTCANLAAMGVGAFVMRHKSREIIEQVGAALPTPLLNAGNGNGEHPSQGLLDALTLCAHFHYKAHRAWDYSLQGRTIAIVGDIAHSRVARSDVHVLERLGAQVTLAGPPELLPEVGQPGWGEARRTSSLEDALEGADAVIVLRVQRERLGQLEVDPAQYAQRWRVGQAHLALMKPDAVVLHPGPVIRGEELEAQVADGPKSLILQQVRCGVAVRQALLLSVMGAA